MNKNKKTYLLIVAVLIIWGTVGYKMIIGLRTNTSKMVVQDYIMSFNPKVITTKDTFSIRKLYNDPFLGVLATTKQKVSIKSIGIVKKAEYIPSIIYSGIVKKQNASDEVFVVTINNKQHLLKQGQTVDSITLIKGNTKAITVEYRKKPKTINRN